jgi:transcription initiation factor TFIID TATA-box-binding protein
MNINLGNSPNQFVSTPHITYYHKNSLNDSLLDATSPNNLNVALMDNDQEQNSINIENDNEPETPKMNINIYSNEKKFIESTNHEDPQNEKSTNTETKTSTNKVNSNKEIEIIPTIQNIVSTAQLNCKLKLKEIALQEQNTQYEPKRFSGLIMRINEPRTTSLIFSNGKIVVLGAKNEEDSFKACKRIRNIIRSLNYPAELTNFKIQNIVGSCDVKFQIKLSQLNLNIRKHVNESRVGYEPEVFPGLIYRLIPDKSQKIEKNEKSPNIALLIFASGNIVITGGKNRNQIYDAFKKIYPLLYQVKEGNVPNRKK